MLEGYPAEIEDTLLEGHKGGSGVVLGAEWFVLEELRAWFTHLSVQRESNLKLIKINQTSNNVALSIWEA